MPKKERVHLQVPELSLDLINDAIEYHSHSIVNGCMEDDLEDHWHSLRYFWKISEPQQPNYGRIFHRVRLAELLYYGCQAPYDDGEGTSMVNWEAHEWDKLRDKLVRLSNSCKRRDANELGGPQMQGDHPRAKDKDLFGKKIDHLLRHIRINRHLSVFRLDLEEWMESHWRRDSSSSSRNQNQPRLSSEKLKQFWKALEEEKNGKLQRFLSQFLTDDSTANHPVLPPMNCLAPILQKKPCNLESLQADIISLVIGWNRALFPEGAPALTRLGYGNVEHEGAVSDSDNDIHRKPAAVENLRHARARLPSDPLPEVYETASRAHANAHDNGEIKQEEEEEEDAARSHRQSLGSSRARRQEEEEEESDETTLSDLRKQQRKKRSSKDHGSAAVQADNDDDDEASEITEPTPRSSQKKRRRHKRSHEEEDYDDEEESPRRRQKRHLEEEEEEESRSPREENRSPLSRSSSQRIRREKRRREQNSAKKKQGVRLKFDDSDEDDDDIKSVRLSELPHFRQRQRKPSPKPQEPRKRKFFTQEEKEAIRKGVIRFGKKWKDILAHYPHILGDRTNIQIKDCHRTMEKNGEL